MRLPQAWRMGCCHIETSSSSTHRAPSSRSSRLQLGRVIGDPYGMEAVTILHGSVSAR
jgi:hypothetical protein